MPGLSRLHHLITAILTVLVLAGASACGSTPASGGPGHLRIVAAENTWGSLATQLVGTRGAVTSILNDPNVDPHDYETNAADALAVAQADYVIVNGAGYDTWIQHLLDTGNGGMRRVLVVADLLGKHTGDNPHFWYDPAAVDRVVARIAADLTGQDDAGTTYFAQRLTAVTHALAPYHALIAKLATDDGGRPIAATESIVVPLATALKLDVISPPAFMNAVAEGTDPPAQAVAQMRGDLGGRRVVLLIYNAQTVTPTTSALRDLAAQHHIATVGITESIQPTRDTFEEWQVAQLMAIAGALGVPA